MQSSHTNANASEQRRQALTGLSVILNVCDLAIEGYANKPGNQEQQPRHRQTRTLYLVALHLNVVHAPQLSTTLASF